MEDMASRRKHKRAFLDNDSEEEMDLDFEILDFTKDEVQFGSTTKYKVLNNECREISKSFREIEAVSKRDSGDTWKKFVEWATSKGLFKAEYIKNPPKQKDLPPKRDRK
jgi:hypothetical protein